jgi:hypothetical protein
MPLLSTPHRRVNPPSPVSDRLSYLLREMSRRGVDGLNAIFLKNTDGMSPARPVEGSRAKKPVAEVLRTGQPPQTATH